MCAIVGLITDPVPADAPVAAERTAHFRALLQRMLTTLRHRGPDGEGSVFDTDSGRGADAYLGHRRLSILAPGPLADQPMRSADGRYTLSFNGAIYNFVELARDLDVPPLLARSDTAVLLSAWARWGVDCLARLNGMFAFAVWDARDRTLHLCRDRFGEKPLLYVRPTPTTNATRPVGGGVRLAYASEAKALLAVGLAAPRLSAPALAEFLATHAIDHRPGQTLFLEIAQVEPGTFLTLRPDGQLRHDRYYRLPLPTADRSLDGAGRAALLGDVDALLRDAVRLRLRSDVPLAGSLSGGMDSSLLTALVRDELRRDAAGPLPYPVLSCQFRHATVPGDESSYIDQVAAHLGISATATDGSPLIVVTPTAADLVRDLDTVLFHQEAPFADTSIVAHYALLRTARDRGIKVLLSGQGGDEIFAGYPSYGYALLGQLLRTGDISTLWRNVLGVPGQPAARLWAAAVYHALPPPLHEWIHAHRRRGSMPLSPDGARLLTQAPPRFSAPLSPWCTPPADRWGPFDRYRVDCIERWALPHILRHDDRNSMALGIESRAPYLDHRLLDLMLTVAPTSLIGDGRPKRLLREVATGRLPETVRLRPDKRGFFSPQRDWLRARESEDRLRAACQRLPAPLDALLDARRLSTQIDAFYRCGHGDSATTAALWLAWVSAQFVGTTLPRLVTGP